MFNKKINRIKKTENRLLLGIAFLSSLNSLILLTVTYKKWTWLALMRFEYINIIYVLLAVSFIGIIIKFRSKPDFLSICKKIILTFLPTEIILLTGFYFGANFNYLLKLSAGLYLMLAFIYLIFKFKKYENIKDLINEFKNEQKEYFLVKLIKDKFSYAIIILISFLYFVFGFYNISKFAAVDEPLWTDGRISKYWNNIK